MFSFFVASCISVKCSDVYPWQMSCNESNLSNREWAIANCQADNTWNQPCEVYDKVNCTGEKSFLRKQWCPNRKGKNYSIAVILSFLGGIFGLDRFYLGYPTIGFMKMFTFGFFFVGYVCDIILVTTQRVMPSNGMGFYVSQPFPILSMNPHHDLV